MARCCMTSRHKDDLTEKRRKAAKCESMVGRHVHKFKERTNLTSDDKRIFVTPHNILKQLIEKKSMTEYTVVEATEMLYSNMIIS